MEIHRKEKIEYKTRDGDGNDIVKEVKIKKFEEEPVEILCSICHEKSDFRVLVKKVVSSDFTDWQYVGEYICPSCADLFSLKYHILDCLGEADCWEMCKRFALFPESKEEERIFRVTNMDFQKQYARLEKENGIDLSIIGMRKKESERRRLLLSHRGEVYQTKSRKSITCCPLSAFTNDDIWAYIFSNNLPYLTVYDYPYLDRRTNRNEITLLYNDSIIRNGMIFHYKQMYSEFFRWLKNR